MRFLLVIEKGSHNRVIDQINRWRVQVVTDPCELTALAEAASCPYSAGAVGWLESGGSSALVNGRVYLDFRELLDPDIPLKSRLPVFFCFEVLKRSSPSSMGCDPLVGDQSASESDSPRGARPDVQGAVWTQAPPAEEELSTPVQISPGKQPFAHPLSFQEASPVHPTVTLAVKDWRLSCPQPADCRGHRIDDWAASQECEIDTLGEIQNHKRTGTVTACGSLLEQQLTELLKRQGMGIKEKTAEDFIKVKVKNQMAEAEQAFEEAGGEEALTSRQASDASDNESSPSMVEDEEIKLEREIEAIRQKLKRSSLKE
ncbi:hypothetical protein STEG23_011587 [Scotinomys teguina]